MDAHAVHEHVLVGERADAGRLSASREPRCTSRCVPFDIVFRWP